MQENPILNRDVRARWRRPAMAFWFCVYSLIVAWATHYTYAGANYVSGSPGGHFQDPFASVGQKLFSAVALLQIYLTSIFAAVVTAPSIVTERESGTLQNLRTAPLTLQQLVYGKYCGTLLVVLLLTCVPLPAVSIAFFMGGVSAPEFLAVSVVEFTSGAVCGAIGIYCSTVSRTAFLALVRAVVLSFFTLWVPVALVSNIGQVGYPALLAFSLALAAGLVVLCTERSVARLWAERYEASARSNRPYYGPLGTAPALGDLRYQYASERLARGTPVDSRMAQGDEWAETVRLANNIALTPVGRWLSFANPVLQRQLRHSFRFIARGTRQDWCERGRLLRFGAVVWACWLVCTMYLGGRNGSELGMVWMGLLGVVAVIRTVVEAATSFSRERAQNMLQGLLLTPLSSREVAGAKRDAALATGLFYLLLGAPLYSGALITNHLQATSLLLTFVALLVAGSTLGIVSARICRNAGLAVVLACTCLLFLFIVCGHFVEAMHGIVRHGSFHLFNRVSGPLLLWFFEERGPAHAYVTSLAGFCAALGASALAILPVLRTLSPRSLERDAWSEAGKLFSPVK